ncbi:MAG TPA: antibiotic biosynthesis monooxygenase [Candidatus Krumholzibacteria bacterium]|nr:antibiotic biosynthesis monooxygenase [Candidatus Krumholzibacteria bacterium]
MYIAMNRFRIAPGREDGFESLWRERTSYLHTVPGFKEFRLLRGAAGEDYTVIISHSTWASEADFLAWTESEAFRLAHGRARSPEGTVLGPPQFEGYTVVL